MTIAENEESASTSLVLVEKADALTVFQEPARIEQLVARVRALATSEVMDASTPAGRAAIKAMAYKVKRSKTYLDGVGKELVDELKELPKRIDACRKQAREELDRLHDEVRQPLTAWETEQERIKSEKAAAERAEQEKIAAVQSAITGFIQAPLDLIGKKHADIVTRLGELEEQPPEADFFGDRQDEAVAAWNAATDKLRQMAEQAEAIEKAEQVERERRIAEQAAEQARQAADQKILDARMAEQRAQQEKESAELRARDAEERAERERQEAAQREEQARQQAAEQERQRIAAQQEAERQAEAARAADIEHRKKINNGAVNCLITHACLTVEQGRAVVKAIAAQQVSNITITY